MIGRRRRNRVGASQGWISVSLNSHREETAKHLGIFEDTHTYLHVCVYSNTKRRKDNEKGERIEDRRGRKERKKAKESKQNEKEGRRRQEGGRQREREKKGLSINDSDMNFLPGYRQH